MSLFSVVTTTVYVTTFCVMVALSRTWDTTPRNVSPGKVSTVNVAFWPWWMRPMSASLTEAQICTRLRSLAKQE